ncbi:hypothetical protein RCL1_000825 [Eukaryota sp. TZLM3-RCL]
MDTYAGPQATWEKYFMKMINSMPMEKVGIGLMSTHSNTGKFLTEEEIAYRFEMIKKYGVQYVALWKGPVHELMIPYVRDYLRS